MAEAQVRSLTSTLSATFTTQKGLGPLGVQSQGQEQEWESMTSGFAQGVA